MDNKASQWRTDKRYHRASESLACWKQAHGCIWYVQIPAYWVLSTSETETQNTASWTTDKKPSSATINRAVQNVNTLMCPHEYAHPVFGSSLIANISDTISAAACWTHSWVMRECPVFEHDEGHSKGQFLHNLMIPPCLNYLVFICREFGSHQNHNSCSQRADK